METGNTTGVLVGPHGCRMTNCACLTHATQPQDYCIWTLPVCGGLSPLKESSDDGV